MANIKVYTIEITSFPKTKPNIWYSSRIGRVYQAQLVQKELDGEKKQVFTLSESPFFHVYPEDCEVKSSKTVETVY